MRCEARHQKARSRRCSARAGRSRAGRRAAAAACPTSRERLGERAGQPAARRAEINHLRNATLGLDSTHKTPGDLSQNSDRQAQRGGNGSAPAAAKASKKKKKKGADDDDDDDDDADDADAAAGQKPAGRRTGICPCSRRAASRT